MNQHHRTRAVVKSVTVVAATAAVLLFGCGRHVANPTRVPVPVDLVVEGMSITLQTGSSCAYTSTELGIEAVIKNQGGAAAGPFDVDVDGMRQRVPNLAGEAELSLWFSTHAWPATNIATVDIDGQVAETDENNNVLTAFLPIPTLPVPCTPTTTSVPSDTLTTSKSATPEPKARLGLLSDLSNNPQIEYRSVAEESDRESPEPRPYLYVGGGMAKRVGHYLLRIDHRTGQTAVIDSREALRRAIAPLTPSDGRVAAAAIFASGDDYLASYNDENIHVTADRDTMDLTLWHSPYFGCASGAVTRVTFRFTLQTGEFHSVEETPVHVPTATLCVD